VSFECWRDLIFPLPSWDFHQTLALPQYYRLKAIGLNGVDIDLSMAEKGSGKWFKDERVQQVFEEVMTTDLVQITHRSRLRNINETGLVHIYMYHNRPEWMAKLQEVFGLPQENLKEKVLNNDTLYGFEDKCREYAEKARDFCTARRIRLKIILKHF
jgi:hypothetical protein